MFSTIKSKNTVTLSHNLVWNFSFICIDCVDDLQLLPINMRRIFVVLCVLCVMACVDGQAEGK